MIWISYWPVTGREADSFHYLCEAFGIMWE